MLHATQPALRPNQQNTPQHQNPLTLLEARQMINQLHLSRWKMSTGMIGNLSSSYTLPLTSNKPPHRLQRMGSEQATIKARDGWLRAKSAVVTMTRPSEFVFTSHALLFYLYPRAMLLITIQVLNIPIYYVKTQIISIQLKKRIIKNNFILILQLIKYYIDRNK